MAKDNMICDECGRVSYKNGHSKWCWWCDSNHIRGLEINSMGQIWTFKLGGRVIA